MAESQSTRAVANPTTADKYTEASMDDNHATQARGDPITGDQTDLSPPRTLRLQPTQEPNTEIDVLDLDSPLSSARSLSPPPHFEAHSPFSSPGPSTGPVTLAGLPQDSEIQEHTEPQPENEPQEDEENPDGEATDQKQPEGAVADPSTRVSKRNTTEEAKTKAEKINGAGVPHANGRCRKCINGDHPCVVNPAISGGNTCSKCAEHKEKCSHQLREDGYSVRTNGRRVARPCNNCAKKIQQGLPAECFQADTLHSKKLGTACSDCMIHGTANTCSLKKKKKTRARKARARKARARNART